MNRPNMDDFKGVDGKTDWTAYDKAQKAYRQQQVANGDYCYQCGAYILFGGKGYQQSCGDCRGLIDSSSISHKSKIRCPYCRHTFNPAESDNYEVYQEGEHTVYCGMCDKDFEVSTHIQHTFHSPALIHDEEPEDDEDEDEEDNEEE